MIKFYTLVLLTGFYFLNAQEIKEILISQNGSKAVVTFQLKNTSISIDSDGNLMNMEVMNVNNLPINNNMSVTFQSDAELNYQDPKSTFPHDSILEYYDQFYGYKSGKIKSVDAVPFDYYDNFYPYQAGKISSVGAVKFEYYDGFNSYEKGKIKSVGNIQFAYNDNFHPYKSGKLKSIKGNKNGTKITLFNE